MNLRNLRMSFPEEGEEGHFPLKETLRIGSLARMKT
jgi:hypothetical protein